MMGAASTEDFFKGGGENSLRNSNREKKEDRANRKQIDNDYRAATSKIPDQKANEPWGAIRPAPSTLSPKTPTVAAQKRSSNKPCANGAANIAKLPGVAGRGLSMAKKSRPPKLRPTRYPHCVGAAGIFPNC
jgi:hypothetical protein